MVSPVQTGPCLRHLLDSIHALKRKRRLQLTLIAALWSLLPAVVILFAAAGLDVLCHFSHPSRYIAFGIIALAVIAAFVFIIRTALVKLSDQAMATLLEKARPDADNAFINAVQFAASENASPEIVETLLADTDVNPATIKASETYSKRPLKWLAAALPAVLLAVVVSMVAAPERMTVALQRILRPGSGLLPYAKTRIARDRGNAFGGHGCQSRHHQSVGNIFQTTVEMAGCRPTRRLARRCDFHGCGS